MNYVFCRDYTVAYFKVCLPTYVHVNEEKKIGLIPKIFKRVKKMSQVKLIHNSRSTITYKQQSCNCMMIYLPIVLQ